MKFLLSLDEKYTGLPLLQGQHKNEEEHLHAIFYLITGSHGMKTCPLRLSDV